jgi:hypothetical protein
MNPYTADDLIKGIKNPKLIMNELSTQSRSVARWAKKSTYKYYSRSSHGSAIDMMSEEWDNLIILDACCFAHFRQVCDLQGNLTPVLSPGTSSWEYMQETFVGKQFHDTVYVSGNAHTSKLEEDVFHAIFPVEMENASERNTQYPGPLPEESDAILPESVVEQSLTVHKEFPHKKYIIHFMQPHLPFLGKYGRNLYRQVLESTARDQLVGESRWGTSIAIWDAVKHSETDVSDADVKKAHLENLEIVLGFVEYLVNELNGRSVITSDHGQLLGEKILTKKRYGHPHDIHPKKLIEVPWFEIKGKKRRSITEEDPINSKRMSSTEIKEKLYALGYVDEV